MSNSSDFPTETGQRCSNKAEHACKVVLMPYPEELPSESLCSRISPEALNRAQSFSSHKRRIEFLWGRVLLKESLRLWDCTAVLCERPPLTPLIKSEAEYFASISHTSTWLATAVATTQVAVDVEVMKPERVRAELFDRVFSEKSWEKMGSVSPVFDFYRMWGIYECAVKLGGKISGLGDQACVKLPDERLSDYCRSFILSNNTLLTVVADRIPVDLKFYQAGISSDGKTLNFEERSIGPAE